MECGKDCVIVGDINVDYLCSLNSDQKRLNDISHTRDYYNFIDFPTRVTETTSTCLDHAYASGERVQAGTVSATAVKSHLSDHYAVRVEIMCEARTRPVSHFARSYTRENIVNFAASIESVDWCAVSNKPLLANDLAKAIVNIFKNKLDVCFPIKRVTPRKPMDSWVTEEIVCLDFVLRETKSLIIKFPQNASLAVKLNEFQDRYNKTLKTERSNFYCNIISSSTNITKTMWDVVKLETGQQRRNSDIIESLRTGDGSKFRSKTQVINAANSHFVHAAINCGAPVADVTASLLALTSVRPPADRAIRMRTFTPFEVFKIISSGVAHKHTKDIYEMSVSLVHAVAVPLSPVLAKLFNVCLRDGLFPQTLKNVRVSPLYKGKGKKEDVNSYRPVSIIPSLAKIFEHGLSSRITEYLSATNALSDRQYAYRTGRSTTDVARELVRRVMEAREQGQQVAVIMCDLSKAFDVADHKVLAAKMRNYGLDGPALELLVDFMTDRYQTILCDGGRVASRPLKTSIGVAQGSSLSNIMFSLLLNDLPDCIDEAYTLLYADDVAAVVTASTMGLLERRLNMVAEKLHNWFCQNGFLLNVSKTNFMHINLSGHYCAPLNVSLGGISISQVRTAAFLGFHVDDGLKWELHINKLCERIGRACFALWRLSATLETSMARSCYFASVHSLLQYGVELWGRAADWERVFRIQKRAVRAIVRVPWDSPAGPIFRSLRIMTLPSLVIYHAAIYARNHLDEYPRFGDGHRYGIRNPHRMRAVPRRLTKTSKLVHVMGPAVYNRLPGDITNAPSTQSFKRKLKEWLIEMCFYKFSDLFVL